jgi:hypothetical protein
MYIETLCTPAILFVMIMMFHVIFELYDEKYSMALVKFFCSIVVILFLQLLCAAHMEIIAWVIVFLPIIIYSYMTFLLFFVFGTNPTSAIKQFEVK